MISFHTLNGALALACGLALVLLPRGSAVHRRIGYLYVASMYVLCGVSFGIRDTTPFFRGLGAFHVMALVSAATLTAGLLPVLRAPRRSNWFERHFAFMLWSYVGLLMAFGSHFVEPLFLALRDLSGAPVLAIALTAGLLWVAPVVAGRVLIPRAGRIPPGVQR